VVEDFWAAHPVTSAVLKCGPPASPRPIVRVSPARPRGGRNRHPIRLYLLHPNSACAILLYGGAIRLPSTVPIRHRDSASTRSYRSLTPRNLRATIDSSPSKDRKGSPRCAVRTHSTTLRQTSRPAKCWCRASGACRRAGGNATHPPSTSAAPSTPCADTAASPGRATRGRAGTASSARPSAAGPPPARSPSPDPRPRSAPSAPSSPRRSPSGRRRERTRRRKSFDRAEVRPIQRVASAPAVR
jgi:hypothetical protein